MPDLVRVPLGGVPAGTCALVAPREDGTLPRDRKGRAKVRKVRLAADGTLPAAIPSQDSDGHGVVDGADWRWLAAAATRRWPTVTARFGDDAWRRVVELARAGVVTIDCSVDGLRLGAPAAVRLTGAWAAAAAEQRDRRSDAHEDIASRAQTLAVLVSASDPGLAEALAAARGHHRHLPVLVAAAGDLVAGTSHDGPRAFSQAHFGDTKARDDAPSIILAAGGSPASLAALGLTRSPYVGLGGAIAVIAEDGQDTDLRGFAGPVRFRAGDGTRRLRARLLPDDGTVVLAVVENLQAAETACDSNGPHVAVAWCAGQPGDRPLDLIAALGGRAARVLVAPDADLGGVRIAARVLGALTPGTDAQVLDTGTERHEPRKPFSASALGQLAAIARKAPHEQVRAFAAAVLARGYPVEQEASARAVLSRALR